jgi:hypothetical protein
MPVQMPVQPATRGLTGCLRFRRGERTNVEVLRHVSDSANVIRVQLERQAVNQRGSYFE